MDGNVLLSIYNENDMNGTPFENQASHFFAQNDSCWLYHVCEKASAVEIDTEWATLVTAILMQIKCIAGGI